MQAFNSSFIILTIPLLWLISTKGFSGSSIGTKVINGPRELLAEKRKRSTTCLYEKPGWLDDAMEGIPSGEFDLETYKKGIDLKPGIAGFAVDPELGFVSILATKKEIDGGQHWIPAVISPNDKDRPKSAEALTCVQLAGGLDLGTAILPPNSLAKLVANRNTEDEGDAASRAGSDVSSSARLSLMNVTALPNPKADNDARMSIEEETQEVVKTTPERNQAVLDAVPKVEQAVKTLPGLEQCTTDDVKKAVQRFADSKGIVDRIAFSSILVALRETNDPSTTIASPLFRFEVSIIDEKGISQVTIDTSDAMIALGLAMRYKVTVHVEGADDHKQGGYGKDALLDRFPAFRPIQELNEDSKIIDGFIPSMFEKAKLDNDMKGE